MSASAGRSIRGTRGASLSSSLRYPPRPWPQQPSESTPDHAPQRTNESPLPPPSARLPHPSLQQQPVPPVLPRNSSSPQQQQSVSASMRRQSSPCRNIPFHSVSARATQGESVGSVLPPAALNSAHRGSSQPIPAPAVSGQPPAAARASSQTSPHNQHPSGSDHSNRNQAEQDGKARHVLSPAARALVPSASTKHTSHSHPVPNTAVTNGTVTAPGYATLHRAAPAAPSSRRVSSAAVNVSGSDNTSSNLLNAQPPASKVSRHDGARPTRMQNSEGPSVSSAAVSVPPRAAVLPSAVYVEKMGTLLAYHVPAPNVNSPRHNPSEKVNSQKHPSQRRDTLPPLSGPTVPSPSGSRRVAAPRYASREGGGEQQQQSYSHNGNRAISPPAQPAPSSPLYPIESSPRRGAVQPRASPPDSQKQLLLRQQQQLTMVPGVVDYYATSPSHQLGQHRHVRCIVAGDEQPSPTSYNPQPLIQRQQQGRYAQQIAPRPAPAVTTPLSAHQAEEAMENSISGCSEVSSTRSSRSRQVLRRPAYSTGPPPAGSPYRATPMYAVAIPRSRNTGTFSALYAAAAPPPPQMALPAPPPRQEDAERASYVNAEPHQVQRPPQQKLIGSPPRTQKQQTPLQWQQQQEQQRRAPYVPSPSMRYVPLAVPVMQVTRYYGLPPAYPAQPTNDADLSVSQESYKKAEDVRAPAKPVVITQAPLASAPKKASSRPAVSTGAPRKRRITAPPPLADPDTQPQSQHNDTVAPHVLSSPAAAAAGARLHQHRPRRASLISETVEVVYAEEEGKDDDLHSSDARSPHQPQQHYFQNLQNHRRHPQKQLLHGQLPSSEDGGASDRLWRSSTEVADQPSSATVAAPLQSDCPYHDEEEDVHPEEEVAARPAVRGAPPVPLTRHPAAPATAQLSPQHRRAAAPAVMHGVVDVNAVSTQTQAAVRPAKDKTVPTDAIPAAAVTVEEEGQVYTSSSSSSTNRQIPAAEEVEVLMNGDVQHPAAPHHQPQPQQAELDSSVDTDAVLAHQEAQKMAAELLRLSQLPPTPYVPPQAMLDAAPYSDDEDEVQRELPEGIAVSLSEAGTAAEGVGAVQAKSEEEPAVLTRTPKNEELSAPVQELTLEPHSQGEMEYVDCGMGEGRSEVGPSVAAPPLTAAEEEPEKTYPVGSAVQQPQPTSDVPLSHQSYDEVSLSLLQPPEELFSMEVGQSAVVDPASSTSPDPAVAAAVAVPTLFVEETEEEEGEALSGHDMLPDNYEDFELQAAADTQRPGSDNAVVAEEGGAGVCDQDPQVLHGRNHREEEDAAAIEEEPTQQASEAEQGNWAELGGHEQAEAELAEEDEDAAAAAALEQASTVEPLEEAMMDAAYMLDTLEEQYVRINEETGEEMEDLVHIVELHRRNRATAAPRSFVAKGQYADVLPFLRYTAPSPSLQVRPLTYFGLTESAYLNICAVVWLTRFQAARVPVLLNDAQGKQHARQEEEDKDSNADLGVYLDHPASALLDSLDILLREQVQNALEATCAESSISLSTACVQLCDRNNLATLPASLWQSPTSDKSAPAAEAAIGVMSLVDHVTHVLLQATVPQEAARRLRVRQHAVSDVERCAQPTWGLFAGALPWNVEEAAADGGADDMIAMPSAAARLSYEFFYRARQHNLDGGLGGLLFSTLSGQIPETTMLDGLVVQEKLRRALLASPANLAACVKVRARLLSTAAAAASNTEGRARENDPTTTGAPSDWFSPLLSSCVASQYPLPGANAAALSDVVDLYSVAAQLHSFFPTKTERGMHQLCAALLEDMVEQDCFSFPAEVLTADGERLTDRGVMVDALVMEGAQAMRHIVVTLSERNYTAATSVDESSGASAEAMKALLVQFEPSVMAFLHTPVPVDALFAYQRVDGPPAMQPRSEGRKSAIVEVLRLQHLAETIQYAMEMQDAILVASQYTQLVAVHKLRIQRQQQQQKTNTHRTRRTVAEELQMDSVVVGQSMDLVLHATPVLGGGNQRNDTDSALLRELEGTEGTEFDPLLRELEDLNGAEGENNSNGSGGVTVPVRAVLVALCCADPTKPVALVQDYLRHLLLLYYEVRDGGGQLLDAGDLDQLRLARAASAEASMEDWFGETAEDGTLTPGCTPARCDTTRVLAEELAALCPRVLGRREGMPSSAVADAAAAISASLREGSAFDGAGAAVQEDSVLVAESTSRPPLAR